MAKEISGIKHKIDKEFYKIYANHALKDSNNNVITATYLTTGDGKNISAAIAKKEDKLTFGYNEDKIISINSSALSAGTNYKSGPNISIVNDVISGKDWNPEIEQEKQRAQKVEKELNDKFSGYYTKTETSGKDQLSTELNKKQDKLSQSQLSAISSVSSLSNDLKTNYYTKTETEAELDKKQDQLTDYTPDKWNDKQDALSNNQLSAISSVSSKVDKTELDNYYTKSETNNELNKKQDNLSTEQLYNIDHAITTTAGLASEQWVNDQGFAKESDIPSLDNYYTKSETDTELEKKQDNLSIEQLSAISSVSSISSDIKTNYYTTGQIDEKLTKKFDTSAISDYYKKTDTSGAQEISAALETKQDNLTDEQISAISSVSSILNDYPNKMYTSSFDEAIADYYTKEQVDNKISGINVEYDLTSETVTLSLEV